VITLRPEDFAALDDLPFRRVSAYWVVEFLRIYGGVTDVELVHVRDWGRRHRHTGVTRTEDGYDPRQVLRYLATRPEPPRPIPHRACGTPGCWRVHHARGLCGFCYRRAREREIDRPGDRLPHLGGAAACPESSAHTPP
jgi:hypothetical protein